MLTGRALIRAGWRLTALGALSALAAFVPAEATAQRPRDLVLTPADARLEQEFVFITSVRELTDGRVLITAPRDDGIIVADFRSGKSERVGRTGRGPGEYSMATPIRPLSGDSSIMMDLLSRRWLLLFGDKIVVTMPPDAPVIVAAQGFALGADARGNVLTTRSTPPPDGESFVSKKDSTLVVLLSRATAKGDTIAKLRMAPARRTQTTDAQGRITSSSLRRQSLTVPEDALLFLDGWLAVARLEPYRVDWRSPDGKWTHGKALPIPVIRMTDREKRASAERTAKGGNQPVKPIDAVKDWPDELPPFMSGAMIGAPDGSVLIREQRSAEHPNTRYHLVDRHGMLVGIVNLPESDRIVGAGARSVYVVTKDADDIERLVRHPWPIRP